MNRKLKQVLKSLLPPVLVDLARGRRSAEDGPTWQGIYSRLGEVPTRDGKFGARLVQGMVADTQGALYHIRKGEKAFLWHEPLALVSSIVAGSRGAVRVLDFGGGVGSGFAQLLTSLPSATVIEYLVVDLEETCAAGRELFRGVRDIQFATAIPEPSPPFDIVYAHSVLQYI